MVNIPTQPTLMNYLDSFSFTLPHSVGPKLVRHKFDSPFENSTFIVGHYNDSSRFYGLGFCNSDKVIHSIVTADYLLGDEKNYVLFRAHLKSAKAKYKFSNHLLILTKDQALIYLYRFPTETAQTNFNKLDECSLYSAELYLLTKAYEPYHESLRFFLDMNEKAAK